MPISKLMRSNFLLLSAVLATSIPQACFAFGPKAPSPSSIQDKSQFLESSILAFNAKFVNVELISSRNTNSYCLEPEYPQPADPSKTTEFRSAQIELCTTISPILDSGLECKDLIGFTYSSPIVTSHSQERGPTATCYTHASVSFIASLSDKGKTLAQSAFFFDKSNTSVEYNVRAIQSALADLQLLPRQRKALDGFFNATDAFVKRIDEEKAKAAQGEEAKPLTHRVFVEQASLLVAYHRYLNDDLTELAQFGSARDGISLRNQNDVQAINQSIDHLTKAYGLDSEITAKQVADYGRVLLDLLNTYSLTLTTSEKATVQPVMVQLVTQVIPASEAYGDVGAHDAVMKLRSLWETDAFTALLTDKLSVSDDKSTTLILNMSAAAYKIGLSANVDIRTFDARDAERIKSKKNN